MPTDLIVREQPAPLLPMEPEDAALMMERYRALCESILSPDDVIGVPGQPGGFVKRSGWSKQATFYGASTELVHLDVDRDDEGVPTRARAVVRATAVNGRHADGDGACARTEPRFKHANGRQKIEHDLPATAVTRATNRAISNLIGFGQVSAEEADADQGPPRAYGEPASVPEEDGLLRALGDLGASPKPANQLVERAGYLPKIAALAVMWTAADKRDREQPEPEPDVVDDLVEPDASHA